MTRRAYWHWTDKPKSEWGVGDYELEMARNPTCAGCFGMKYLCVDTMHGAPTKPRFVGEICPDCNGTGHDGKAAKELT